jgi:hypothetical protein
MPTALSTKRILFDYNHSHVYPPQAGTSTALKELRWTLCKLETTYPDAAFILAGDFNKANLKTMLPKFYQHIECATKLAAFWIIATLTFATHTKPSLALLSANLTTTLFCCSQPIDRK